MLMSFPEFPLENVISHWLWGDSGRKRRLRVQAVQFGISDFGFEMSFRPISNFHQTRFSSNASCNNCTARGASFWRVTIDRFNSEEP
jgi:hypothetical protein